MGQQTGYIPDCEQKKSTPIHFFLVRLNSGEYDFFFWISELKEKHSIYLFKVGASHLQRTFASRDLCVLILWWWMCATKITEVCSRLLIERATNLNLEHLIEMWCTYLVQCPCDRPVASCEQTVEASVLRPLRVASSAALGASACLQRWIPIEMRSQQFLIRFSFVFECILLLKIPFSLKWNYKKLLNEKRIFIGNQCLNIKKDQILFRKPNNFNQNSWKWK